MAFPYGGMDNFGQILHSSPQSVGHIILAHVVTAPDRISFESANNFLSVDVKIILIFGGERYALL